MNTATQNRDASAAPPPTTPLRIGIAGAGAIGCTLAATLAEAGHAVSMLARGATLDAIRRDGVRLTTAGGALHARVAACDDARQLGAQDVLFLCTKAHDLHALLPSLGPLIGPETRILPLVNGVPWWYFQGLGGRLAGRAVESVDPGGALLRALPSSQVMGAVVFMTAERKAPNHAESLNPMLLVAGELDHSDTPGARHLCAALASDGLATRFSPAIRDTLWVKIIANLSSNPLSVLSGATLEALYSDPRLLPLTRKIITEALALAASYGARIEFDPPTFIAQAAAMGSARTSMLQDALQGRPLELRAIGEAVLELARLNEVAMPVTQDIIALVNYRDEASRAAQPHSGAKS